MYTAPPRPPSPISPNMPAPFIASTTPIPQVFLDTSSKFEDILLIFPDPDTNVPSGNFGRDEFFVEMSMEPTTSEQFDSLGFFLAESDEEISAIGNAHMVLGNSMAMARHPPTNTDFNDYSDYDERDRRVSIRQNERRRRRKKRPRHESIRRRRIKNSQNSMTRPVEGTLHARTRDKQNRQDHSRNSPIKRRRHQQSGNLRKRPRRIKKKPIRDDYYDYYSAEGSSLEERFTEDFDDYSNERSVEQWYFDYYDYNLDHNRIALQTNNNDSIAENTTNQDLKSDESKTTPPQELNTIEPLAEIINTEELLQALNVSSMTNVAALLTFFNNQELFKILREGKTHRETFNKLVRRFRGRNEEMTNATSSMSEFDITPTEQTLENISEISGLPISHEETGDMFKFMNASLTNNLINGSMLTNTLADKITENFSSINMTLLNQAMMILSSIASNTNPKGGVGGKTIGENIASFGLPAASGNQVTGSSRSLIQSQPALNQLATTAPKKNSAFAQNTLVTDALATPTLPSVAGPVSGSNALGSSILQQLSQQGIPGQAPSRANLPPHPATLALQRKRLQNQQLTPQPARSQTQEQSRIQTSAQAQFQVQQQTRQQLPRNQNRQQVTRPRVTSTPRQPGRSITDNSAIMQSFPSADTLNKFLINVGKDSQVRNACAACYQCLVIYHYL